MEAISLGELLAGIGPTKIPEIMINEVVTDSRLAKPGSVFVAIVGERLDGNDYVPQALANGASAVVASRKADAKGEQVIVSDTKSALISMAKNYRMKFSPVVAAVTGSVGKTTTKELLSTILSQFGKTLKNEGNMNNEIGVPMTLFNLEKSHELAVIEMGMDRIGDISKLTDAARPRAAIITAIGVTHIEHLGSRENILKAKLEIIEGLDADGFLVLNADDDMLMSAKDKLNVETVTFSINNTESDIIAKNITNRSLVSEFTIVDRINGSFDAVIPAVGNFVIMDALAAYAVATRLGYDPEKSVKALAEYQPSGMRQHIVDLDGITIIEDCYNANPDSMRAALSALSTIPVEGIRCAVLGDMLELGKLSNEAHRRVGLDARNFGIDVLLCYGKEMEYCAMSAKASGVSDVRCFENKDDIAEYLAKTLRAGDAVVFKGSRGMKLEDVIEKLYMLKSKK